MICELSQFHISIIVTKKKKKYTNRQFAKFTLCTINVSNKKFNGEFYADWMPESKKMSCECHPYVITADQH